MSRPLQAYLTDMFDFYIKHMEAIEGQDIDRAFVADWNSVFWPLNLLMVQETGKGTFHDQVGLYLAGPITPSQTPQRLISDNDDKQVDYSGHITLVLRQ